MLAFFMLKINIKNKKGNYFFIIAAKGTYIGASCEFTCNAKLENVFCDPTNNKCGCEKNYPVIIGLTAGCAKRKFMF